MNKQRINMQEIWKDVPNFKGYYQVSNLGRVKSLERLDSMNRLVTEKILKQSNAKYPTVTLTTPDRRVCYRLHELLAEVFLGHISTGRFVHIDHIDNDSRNNNISNLQIVSARHNLSKDKKNGSSDYVGVSWASDRDKWRARIYIDGKTINLGQFDCELDAAKAYQSKLKEIL